jgi:cytochrome P450
MEYEIALNALLDRLPNLRLDPNAAPPVMTGLRMRAPDRLPVVYG